MTAHIRTSSNLEERSQKNVIQEILVPLEGLASNSAAVDVALLLGRQFQAHIEAFYAKTTRGDPSTSRIKRRGSDDGEIGLADKMEASRVRELFTSRCNSHEIKELSNIATGKLSANFLEVRGIEADLIVEHGRLSDLIVFAHAASIDPHWPNISVQTALQETARPVLLVPSTATRIGKRNVIAWNGSLESPVPSHPRFRSSSEARGLSSSQSAVATSVRHRKKW